MTVLKVLENEDASRARRDRLELLTALMMAPGFDPLYRSDLIAIPPQHPVYGWECVVEGCGRVKRTTTGSVRSIGWSGARRGRRAAAGLPSSLRPAPGRRRACPRRAA